MSDATYSLLIIDDNAYMRTSLNALARACGVSYVEEAANGADAFERLRHRRFDCAMVDLNMDPINGIEFLKLLRRGKDSPDRYLATIVISGYSERSRILEARDAGADEFLRKPVTAAAVMARLRAVVQNRRPFIETRTFFGPDRRRVQTPGYRGPWRRKTDQVIDTYADTFGAD